LPARKNFTLAGVRFQSPANNEAPNPSRRDGHCEAQRHYRKASQNTAFDRRIDAAVSKQELAKVPYPFRWRRPIHRQARKGEYEQKEERHEAELCTVKKSEYLVSGIVTSRRNSSKGRRQRN